MHTHLHVTSSNFTTISLLTSESTLKMFNADDETTPAGGTGLRVATESATESDETTDYSTKNMSP